MFGVGQERVFMQLFVNAGAPIISVSEREEYLVRSPQGMQPSSGRRVGKKGRRPTFGAGAVGGVVDMTACAIPVARNRLGVESGLHIVHLADAIQQEPRHPQLVSARNAGAGPHLHNPSVRITMCP